MLVAGLRRWVHHAQLELIPVIVPQDAASGEVIAPRPATLLARMARDVHDAFNPPRWPRYAVLTFDDGPYPVATPLLLAQLSSLQVPADLFFIGRDAVEQPAIAGRAAAELEIGNHTLSHPEMASLDRQAQLEEVLAGAASIQRSIGRPVTYFRPPHGSYDANTIDAARAAGERFALWDVDPGDWRAVTPDFILENVTTHAKSPAVILLHDGSAATISALPRIVAAYRRAGFEFVTLSELQQRMPLDAINDPVSVHVASAP